MHHIRLVERQIAGGLHFLRAGHLPADRAVRGHQVLAREIVRGQGVRVALQLRQSGRRCRRRQRTAQAIAELAAVQSLTCRPDDDAHGPDADLVRVDADRDDVQCVADTGGDSGRRCRVLLLRLGAPALGGGGRALSLSPPLTGADDYRLASDW